MNDIIKKSWTLGLCVLISAVSFAQSNEESESILDQSATLVYQSSKSRTWDLLHTALEVSFDWDKRYLYGIAKIDLTPFFYEQEVLVLDAKGMQINAISIGAEIMPFEYDGLKLQINLPRPRSREDTLQVTIDYVAKPYEREVTGSEAIEENRGLYFINADGSEPDKPKQIWTQGETEASSGWFPTIDAPNERCTQQIKITVQDKFITLSNGLLADQIQHKNGKRTDVWEMDQPHAPYLFMMAVGEFTVAQDQWNDVPLAYLMEKDYGQYAKDIFGHTPEMMTFFSDLLGYPYPWKKYDQIVVRDFVSGAMENTSASLFYEALNVNKRYLIDENWDGIIAHELMHQWFGDLVTCESWSNLTLNESFASYSEYLWNQYKYGQDEADYNFIIEQEAYLDEAAESKKNLIRYFYDDKEEMFDAHSYNKGAAVLHMLRNYVGDDAFFQSLNRYLTDNAFQSVELAQLRLAFEGVTGEDLNWFFDQWYFFAGHPILEVQHRHQNDTLTVSVSQMQIEDEVPIFQLPVFIDIWKGEELFSYPVIINEAFETYQFPMKEKPDVVIFDSERQLLSEINHPKTEQEYYAQFVKDGRLYSRVETLDSLYSFKDKKIIDQILLKAFQDPYYVIRQSAIEYLIDKNVKLKKFEPQVAQLLKDSNSHVRSYALAYLGKDGFEKYQTNFNEALYDSSYLVVSSAIAEFTQNKKSLPANFLSSINSETDLNVVITLAEYYNNEKDEQSYRWFQNRMEGLDGNTLFFFIQAYAQKLLDASDDYRKHAIPQLEKVARDHSNYLARFSAFQALVLMIDLEGVDQKIRSIRKKEKDPRLTELYERI